MSDRLPQVKPRELIRVLEKLGWQPERMKGSHQVMVHEELRRVVPVPVHNRDLKAGTLRGIMRSAGIDRNQLKKLL